MNGECVDNYVVSCNPAPKTPVSEVVVVRTDYQDLATTGGAIDGSLVMLAVVFIAIGTVLLGGRRATR